MSSTDQRDPTVCPHCNAKHSINLQALCGSMHHERTQSSRDELGLRMFLEARADLFPIIPALLAEYDGLAASPEEGGGA